MESFTSAFASGRRYGGRSCCVVGCSNPYYQEGRNGVKFFKFPCNEMQKRLWVCAVKRINDDKKNWDPSKYSVICSVHFWNQLPKSLSYTPTIFPTEHKKSYNVKDQERFDRQARRCSMLDCGKSKHFVL